MNKKYKKFHINVIAAVFLLLTACSHTPPVPLAVLGDHTAFLEKIADANPVVRSIKARASFVVTTKEKTYRFKSGLLMNDSGWLFMETYGFGIPQAYASILDDRLKIIFPSQRKEYVGSGSSSLAKFLNMNVSFYELFDPLLRKIEISQNDPPTMTVASREYLVTDADKTEFFVKSSGWIKKIQRRRGYIIEYGDPWSDKIRYPKWVRLSYQEQSIQIDFNELTINQPLERSIFQISVPSEGFEVLSLLD